jgi:hypothetical protein
VLQINSSTFNDNLDQFSLNEREIKFDEDSHLLDRSIFDNEVLNVKLSFKELSILFIDFQIHRNKTNQNKLNDEILLPILYAILSNDCYYSFVTCSLFEKALIEKDNYNRKLISSQQLFELLEDFQKNEPCSSLRIQDFFSVNHPIFSEIQIQAGFQLCLTGSAKTAINIFKETQNVGCFS